MMITLRFLIILSLIIFISMPAICQEGPGGTEGAGAVTIKKYLEDALPDNPQRKIIVDEGRGILTITDTPTNHILIRDLIDRLDVGPRQISVEAKFVEVVVKNLNELGIEWDVNKAGEINSKLQDVQIGDPNLPSGTHGVQWEDGSNTFPRTTTGADLFVSITSFNSNSLKAYLHTLEETKKGNILSSPNVTTLSGQPAVMQVTRTIPYVSNVTLQNFGTADHPIFQFNFTVNEVVSGLTLEVTPTVPEGSKIITLEIRPQIEEVVDRVTINTLVTDTRLGYPVIDTRKTETVVRVRSGQTIVLGGLIQDDEKTTDSKVPLLGDIPILGKAFRYKNVTKEKKNLLIFVTATIITSSGLEDK